MYIADSRLVFVELPKTGTTHIDHLLSNLLPGRQAGKHNRPGTELLNGGYTFVGSIRNPWDWYRSLWTFGCTRTGGVYELATRPRSLRDVLAAAQRHPRYLLQTLAAARRRRPDLWRPLYENPADIAAFRTWLRLIHDPAHWSDYDDGYFLTRISPFAGFYTYRFVSLFARNAAPLFRDASLQTLARLRDFDRRYNYVSHFIRCESLEADLIDVLKACGVAASAAEIERIHGTQKSNVSARRTGIEHFYDEESIALVAERERLIIERFGYARPAL